MNQIEGEVYFVVGIDGSGKTTLLQELRKQKLNIKTTREPGGTPYAEAICRLLFSADGKVMTKEQQLHLFFEARRDHVANLILPTIAAGKTLICDRFDACTFAYQRPDKNGTEDLFWELRKSFVTDHVDPKYVWLQLDVELAIQSESLSAAHNHFDQVDISIVESRVEGYEKFFSGTPKENLICIDASGTAENTLTEFNRLVFV